MGRERDPEPAHSAPGMGGFDSAALERRDTNPMAVKASGLGPVL